MASSVRLPSESRPSQGGWLHKTWSSGGGRQSSRSQPALGLKQSKLRPTIFGTLLPERPPSEVKNRQSVVPQMSGLARMFALAGNGYSLPHAEENDVIIYQDGRLISGSIEALIQHMVPTSTYYPDRTYIFAFLLNSRLFIKPHLLLKEICRLCIYQQGLADDKTTKESLGKFGPNIIQLLNEWTEVFPYDFRDERLMKHLKDITQRIIKFYPDLRKEVGAMMHNLFSRLAHLQKYEEMLTKLHSERAQRLINLVPTVDLYGLCSSPLVLAQQLTHIELQRLSNIGPEEFVQAFAKENELETSFQDMKKTNNLEAYVQWFNRLSYMVATEISMHLKKKQRAKIIEFFIDVAKECFNIGNFNSLMAIIAGLNLSPVSRLKKTWGKVNTDKFDILEHQMDPSNNFASYRSTLKAALWRSQGAVEEREKIVIPFFSLLVKDLYFLNEGCANKMPNGHINFEKFWQLAKQITDFITWKQVECPFEKNEEVLTYVLTTPVFSETSLSLASYECEAPDSSYEKERHKSLKIQAGL
ncbi:ras-GEF domain-containing family member 1B-like isoform X3 [Lineus longissimus]|uniref:ras-GEF domain-containing family member 1B-like isoform X3 n=1 Tax=Lineus longissimus TaxID=88925 RepID=UPI00315D9B3A